MADDLELPDEVSGFGGLLLWLVATRAPALVEQVYELKITRPTRGYTMPSGHPLPTPSLIAWLLTAAEAGVPVEELRRRDTSLTDRQHVMRTMVSRAITEEPHLFRAQWVHHLEVVCGLTPSEAGLLLSSRDAGAHPVDPAALGRAVEQTLARASVGGESVAAAVSGATPYVTAAVGVYGGAVLAKVRDDAADATAGVGLRLLQRVFGRRQVGEPLPDPLALLAADPGDVDALGALRLAIRQALAADAGMLGEVAQILASVPKAPVTQHVHADRDAYAAGRELTINRPGGGNTGTRPPDLGDGAGGSARRFLLARCPEVIPVGKPFSLLASIVQVGMGAVVQLAPFDVPREGRDVLLVVHAPGLRLLGDQRLAVHVPTAGDSAPVMFELRADTEGPRSVSITAWLGGSYLGELLVEVTAEQDVADGQHREFRAAIDTVPSEGAVSLVVRYDPELKTYRFEFRDEDNPNEVVSRLSFEPRQRIERLVADLDRLAAGRGGYSADQARDYLVNAGAELWHELVPPGLREQFWDRQHRIQQLTILADKDTVPWELLYPRDRGHDAGFLVQQFPVTRGTFGRRPSHKLSLRPARFVLPHGSLPEASAEIDAMRRLLDPAQQAEGVISDLTQLQELIRAGDFGLLHFACHNRFDPDDDASITLGSVKFTPRLMTTAVIDRVLARSAPTVFVNACRSAGLAPTYNRLDGWAGKFLEAGAGAFIGTLWAVSDGTAREFAEELYGQLKTGTPLGKAMMSARAKAATHADDPTWLAYSAYGDPRATVTGS